MPLTNLPRWWASSARVVTADLDPSLIAPLSTITSGSLAPDVLGIPVWNDSGGAITAGTPVYITGFNAASGKFTIAKASAAAQLSAATLICLTASIANGAAGVAGKHWLSAANLNTNAATVGDPVWLDTTAGLVTLTNPPATGIIYQRIGRVRVKSATVGQIELDLLEAPLALLIRKQTIVTTVATAAGSIGYGTFHVDLPGTVLGARFTCLEGLATSDTNYVTFTLNNLAVPLLAATDANTTKTTGGSLIAANFVPRVLAMHATPANKVVAAADTLVFEVTVTAGTVLANTLTAGTVSIVLLPS